MGIHVIPPGEKDEAIIACSVPSKIGKKSSPTDLEIEQTGKPAVKTVTDGSFYDLALPLTDANQHPIGMIVMEMRFTGASSADDSIAKAQAITNAIEAKIPSLTALFGEAPKSDPPQNNLLSEPGPTFRISDAEMGSTPVFIAYGDMRFTDPKNVTATNPRVRRFLVKQVAAEHPAAVLLNGDVPLAGDMVNDYVVFHEESQAWRDANIHVFPALGNHEFHGKNPQQDLENWWNAFPELRNRRWYSAQLGNRLYTIALDSDAPLTEGSDQQKWFIQQINGLPKSTDFVVISLHHPPVADIQKHIEVDHNPRPNEIVLRDLLSKMQPQTHAQFIVSAGHIHNYARHVVDGVLYLVSGGGGAHPYFVERTPDDLYQSDLFPNFHYVKFVLGKDSLHVTMYRVTDPEAQALSVEPKDEFELPVRPQ